MTRQHTLEVDGYFATSEERAFEGVMFQVLITETNDNLTIDRVFTRPQDEDYLRKFRMEPFLEEVRSHVQANIDYLKRSAHNESKTINDLLDEWEREAGSRDKRIDLLNEV